MFAVFELAWSKKIDIDPRSLQALLSVSPSNADTVAFLTSAGARLPYDAILEFLCAQAGSFFASEPALSLYTWMLSKKLVRSTTLCAIFSHLTSVEEVQALTADAFEYKLVSKSVSTALLEAYMRCVARVPPRSARAHNWWLPNTIKSVAAAHMFPKEALVVEILQHYAATGSTRPAAALYSLVGKVFPWSFEPASLEKIICALGVRPGPNGPQNNARDMFTQQFLVHLWEHLELHAERAGGVPSEAMHVAMLRLLSMRGSFKLLVTMFGVTLDRYPRLADSAAVLHVGLAACVRAKDPGKAAWMLSRVATLPVDELTVTLLFASVSTAAGYASLGPLAAAVTARAPGLAAAVAEEVRLAALRIACSMAPVKGAACVPVPHVLSPGPLAIQVAAAATLRRARGAVLPAAALGTPIAARRPASDVVVAIRNGRAHHHVFEMLTHPYDGLRARTGVAVPDLGDLRAVIVADTCRPLGCATHG